MSAFTPHPSAPAAIRNLQRYMIIQVVYVLIFAALNQSHNGDPNYYQPNEGLVALQIFLGVALVGCAYGVGQLASWSLPTSYLVEIASLALGIYTLVDSQSGLAAGFIIAGINIYRLSQSDVQQALKRGPQGAGPMNGYAQIPDGTQPPYPGQLPYGGAPFGGAPFGGAPFGGAPIGGQQAPYGAPQAPYGAPAAPYGMQPSTDQPPTEPATDFFGRPLQP